ncbi:unnamed protein product [Protopolystoma xenopodis]|uniref:Uncharacterized protein n=1 Tax=Protopolystoma xenopodis TaxID=117903 RepID=A0A3S5FF42_9PLAT|nr:unnamed protein product [Protopolystoma xenopodis]
MIPPVDRSTLIELFPPNHLDKLDYCIVEVTSSHNITKNYLVYATVARAIVTLDDHPKCVPSIIIDCEGDFCASSLAIELDDFIRSRRPLLKSEAVREIIEEASLVGLMLI